MADKFTTARSHDATALGSDAVAHTPGNTDLPINVKAAVPSADGTIDFKNDAGTTRSSYPVKAGVPLTFVPARITAVSAGTVWLTLG